ncbi:MAG: pentapeptide repeat-containing protein [Oligoflexus sp.]|nr:pentapeptide repeat-containing protein [Oligoflexus sp.]
MRGADLRGAHLQGAILVRADLSTALKLEGADLRDPDLTEANKPLYSSLKRLLCRLKTPYSL